MTWRYDWCDCPKSADQYQRNGWHWRAGRDPSRDARVSRCKLYEKIQGRLTEDANWADQFDGHPDSLDYVTSRQAVAQCRATLKEMNGEAGQPVTVILEEQGRWTRYTPSQSDTIDYGRGQ